MKNKSPGASFEGAMISMFTQDGPAAFPWNGEAGIVAYEALIGRRVASVMWYVTWDEPFPTESCELVRRHGSVPHVTWELFFPSIDPNNTRACAPSETGMDDVLAGKHDAYIDRFALDARAWGHEVLIRFLHEFNGNWYVWSGPKNGRENGGAAKVKAVWRYIVDRFRAAGAVNVKWVWCPHGPSIDLSTEAWNDLGHYWPGSDYVDWNAIDAYNWYPKDPWGGVRPYRDFDNCFKAFYDRLLELAEKPIIIAEMGSGEFDYQGITKAPWVTNAFQRMKASYPWIKMFVWFNIKKELDWRVNSSPEVYAAFKAAMADPYFKSEYVSLA